MDKYIIVTTLCDKEKIENKIKKYMIMKYLKYLFILYQISILNFFIGLMNILQNSKKSVILTFLKKYAIIYVY